MPHYLLKYIFFPVSQSTLFHFSLLCLPPPDYFSAPGASPPLALSFKSTKSIRPSSSFHHTSPIKGVFAITDGFLLPDISTTHLFPGILKPASHLLTQSPDSSLCWFLKCGDCHVFISACSMLSLWMISPTSLLNLSPVTVWLLHLKFSCIFFFFFLF